MLLLLVASAMLTTATASAPSLEISNFRSGLACTNSPARQDGSGWICHVTQDVLVTDQGQCRYNGKDYACTWVGFEFDYRGAKPGDQLACNDEQSQRTGYGNPNEELSPDATSQDFVLPLKMAEGHFYNPQYFTYVTRSAAESVLVSTGHCSFGGNIVFEYTYRVHFPVVPERAAGV